MYYKHPTPLVLGLHTHHTEQSQHHQGRSKDFPNAYQDKAALDLDNFPHALLCPFLLHCHNIFLHIFFNQIYLLHL
jgi:hypothetical protein